MTTPYDVYMATKTAGSAEVIGALAGSSIGMGSNLINPPGIPGSYHTPEERLGHLGLGALIGAGFGAGVANIMKQANPLDRLLDAGHGQTYDRDTHAKILAAKAKFNRSRLVYQQTFRKLPPEGQAEILKHFDSYNRTINKAVMDGKYPSMGSF